MTGIHIIDALINILVSICMLFTGFMDSGNASSTPEVEGEKKRDTTVEKNATQRKNKPCIEFNNVEFAYADTPVYKDLSCSIAEKVFFYIFS